MADAKEQARLLRILEGHGQSFLASFETSTPGDSSKKRKVDKVDIISNKKLKQAYIEESEDEGDEEEGEWRGIGHDRDDSDSCSGGSDEEGEDGSGEYLNSYQGAYRKFNWYLDFEHSDNEFTSAPQAGSKVIVFADPSAKKNEVDNMSRAQMKAFMVICPT
jgi:hypothetical protein